MSNSGYTHRHVFHPNILTALRAEKVLEMTFDPNRKCFDLTAIVEDNIISLSVSEMIQYISELTEFVANVQKLEKPLIKNENN